MPLARREVRVCDLLGRRGGGAGGGGGRVSGLLLSGRLGGLGQSVLATIEQQLATLRHRAGRREFLHLEHAECREGLGRARAELVGDAREEAVVNRRLTVVHVGNITLNRLGTPGQRTINSLRRDANTTEQAETLAEGLLPVEGGARRLDARVQVEQNDRERRSARRVTRSSGGGGDIRHHRRRGTLHDGRLDGWSESGARRDVALGVGTARRPRQEHATNESAMPSRVLNLVDSTHIRLPSYLSCLRRAVSCSPSQSSRCVWCAPSSSVARRRGVPRKCASNRSCQCAGRPAWSDVHHLRSALSSDSASYKAHAAQ